MITKPGIFIRTFIASLLIIAVILLPETTVNKFLGILISALFFSMGAALIFPWRRPDLLGWEFFGLFETLGIIFGVGATQQFGWLPLTLPFVYRAGVRAMIAIFGAGVLTGLVRVGKLQWTAAASQREDVILRLSAVEQRVTAEERRNDRSEALSREAVVRADAAEKRADVAEQRADVSETRADVSAEERADHEERISATEEKADAVPGAASTNSPAPASAPITASAEIIAELHIPEQTISVDNKPKENT